MFDLHCHILPGVDDGADTLEESVKMAALAASGGVRGIVATPHANLPGGFENYWNSMLLHAVDQLQKTLNRENIRIRLYTGQEIFLTEEVPSLLEAGRLLTINRSRFVLAEFDFGEEFSRAQKLLSGLLEAGYTPIVAHPERYRFMLAVPAAAEQLRSMGCLLQINRGSLLGAFGSKVQKTAHFLCRNRLADVVASDGHSPYVRTPYLQDIRDLLGELYSESYAEILLHDNPYRILCGKEIYMDYTGRMQR